jgi:hypothetical protein
MVLRNGFGKGRQACSQDFKCTLKACDVGVNNRGETEGGHDGKEMIVGGKG